MTDDDSFDDSVWDELGEPANPLPLLQKWYATQCDGDWEHGYGIIIETLDHPGWLVKIDLLDTTLDGKDFAPVKMNILPDGTSPGGKWMACHLESGKWIGAGDEHRLNAILLEFLDWAAKVDQGWPVRGKR